MKEWSLKKVLEKLHDDVHQKLENARVLGHSTAVGDASESVWIELFNTYLPERYRAEKAFVVDSKGAFSQQIDVVIFDRQYSPLIFDFNNQKVIPAESVYAVFEAKQSINADMIKYAQEKIESVRKLYRTSLPIPTANGPAGPKPLHRIIGGVLSFESDWTPPLGTSLEKALNANLGSLEFGCVAADGYFLYEQNSGTYHFFRGGKPATAFLFQLISQLQFIATVPMMDVLAYFQWLNK